MIQELGDAYDPSQVAGTSPTPNVGRRSFVLDRPFLNFYHGNDFFDLCHFDSPLELGNLRNYASRNPPARADHNGSDKRFPRL